MKLVTLSVAFVLLKGPAFAQGCDPALAPLPHKQADETAAEPDATFDEQCLDLAKTFSSLMSSGATQQIGLPVSSISPHWGRLVRVDLMTGNTDQPRLVCFHEQQGTKVQGKMYFLSNDRCRTISGFTIYPPGVVPRERKD